jgi:hypothetical protein
MDLKNQRVQFKICDVYHPDPAHVLSKLHGEDLLAGKVIDVSDSGMQKEAFAVVEVDGIEEPIVVPVERIFSVP